MSNTIENNTRALVELAVVLRDRLVNEAEDAHQDYLHHNDEAYKASKREVQLTARIKVLNCVINDTVLPEERHSMGNTD